MNETEERTGVDFPAKEYGIDEDEPPGKPRRHPLWRNVPDKQWDDWRWQAQNAIRSVRQLRELLPFAPEDLEAIGDLEAEYKLTIPPYYFSLIDPANLDDPIRLQSVPSPKEAASSFELDDPLEEDKDSPVPGITHRYPDRCLMVTTHVCTMYCRFCTRKRATMVRGGWDAISHDDERMIDYVRHHPEIRDVIVSGGDPLTLPYNKLRFFLENLRDIPHVDVIRIGTRVPTTLPQKLYDQELLDILAGAEKVWIQTHFNHPREITSAVARVCRSLLRAGVPLNNHTVLMRGVNDNLETMRQLMRASCASRFGRIICSIAILSPGPGTSALRYGRGWRSWKVCAGTCPAWRYRPMWSIVRTAAARFRSCPTTSYPLPTIASSCATTRAC